MKLLTIHIILKKITDVQTPQPDKDKVEYKKKNETTAKDEEKNKLCLLSPNSAIKSNECFNCGEEGRRVNTCPIKL